MANVQRVCHNATIASAVTVSTTTTVLFTGVDMGKLNNLFFHVRNTGAQALNSFILSSSADGVNWIVHDNSTLATLANATDGKITVANNGARFWRATATVAASTTTVTVIVSGN